MQGVLSLITRPLPPSVCTRGRYLCLLSSPTNPALLRFASLRPNMRQQIPSGYGSSSGDISFSIGVRRSITPLAPTWFQGLVCTGAALLSFTWSNRCTDGNALYFELIIEVALRSERVRRSGNLPALSLRVVSAGPITTRLHLLTWMHQPIT
jgi:hypothetical protein